MSMALSTPRYTVAQVKALPHDGNRYELLDGVLLVTPAPANLHQWVIGQLYAQLYAALAETRAAYVVTPGEIESGTRLLLDPDILVYPSTYRPGTHWKMIRGWWLAVEVASRSTRKRDRELKRQAYQKLGVEETWLVDPDSRTVEVWAREALEPLVVNDVIRRRPAGLATEVKIRLADFFPDDS